MYSTVVTVMNSEAQMRSKGLLVPLLKQAYTLESCAIGLQHLTLLVITLLLAALDFSYFPFSAQWLLSGLL